MQTRSPAEPVFERAYDAFRQAGRDAPVSQVDLSLGGYRLRLFFAEPAILVPFFMPALAHLMVEDNASVPDLTLYVWASALQQATLPALPWAGQDNLSRGQSLRFLDEHFLIDLIPQGTLSCLNRESGQALVWIPDLHALPVPERASPFVKIFQRWMVDHNRHLVHAGAVGAAGCCALLAGPSGSGKSTTALSCIKSGLAVLADDYCLIGLLPEAVVYPLYGTGKLKSDSLERIPELRQAVYDFVSIDQGGKHILLLPGFSQGRGSDSLPLKAIFLPRLTGSQSTTVTPATPVAALRALAPSTLFQLPGTEDYRLGMIAHLARQLDCFFLNLGFDLDEIPVAIHNLLSGYSRI